MNRTRTVIVATLAASSLALTACGGGSDDSAAASSPSPSTNETVVIGSANFSENVLLAEIYAQALEAQGVKVQRKMNVGTREDLIPQLKQGKIDLIPEYSGAC